MAWTDGLLRLWPDWEIVIGHRYLIPAVFFPLMAIGLILTVLGAYPFIERKLSKDNALHNLLQRPRDAPVRTSLGAMGIAFFVVLTISCGNDIIADKFSISLNAMTWAGRIGLLTIPPIIYYITYRMCIGLQRADRAVLEHGVETGIIKRLPHGEFIEVHQPLGPVDDHGHPLALPYQAASVPKRMNKLGLAGQPVPGSFLTPDPKEETVALERARTNQHPRHEEHAEVEPAADKVELPAD
jgi:ubiquinol-cytochrome c reductase cytochrome b subunit